MEEDADVLETDCNDSTSKNHNYLSLLILEGPMINTPPLLMTARHIDITSTTDSLDTAERLEVQRFMRDGCGCNAMCSAQFDVSEYTTMRDSCGDLTREHMDLFMMGQLSATTFDSSKTRVGYRDLNKQSRQRPKSSFRHRGQKVNFTNTHKPRLNSYNYLV